MGVQQLFSCLWCDIQPSQPVHQRSDQSLLVVAGDDEQHHGVPGQTLKTGDTAGLSGEERLLRDHPLLDRGEGPQELQYVSFVTFPGQNRNLLVNLCINSSHLFLRF